MPGSVACNYDPNASIEDGTCEYVSCADDCGIPNGDNGTCLDCDGIPQFAGGACMTARDMARYGLLFARNGKGINGHNVGSAQFIQKTRNGRGTKGPKSRSYGYSNATFTNTSTK